MQRLFVSKSRLVKTDPVIQIHEVAGIPLVTGTYSIRWKIRGVVDGHTESRQLRSHAVTFEDAPSAKISVPGGGCVFLIGKEGVLQGLDLKLSVVHAFGGGRTEVVGVIVINLAEYVGREPKIMRYLLESKFNSTVRLTIDLSNPQADAYFETPQLNDAQIFSDVTEAIVTTSSHTASLDPNSNQSAFVAAGGLNLPSRAGSNQRSNSIAGHAAGGAEAQNMVPVVNAKSSRRSLQLALNYHNELLRHIGDDSGAGVVMAREGEVEETAAEQVDKILASCAVFD